MKLGWKRLLKLADILDVADARHRKYGEPTYDQTLIWHDCGTPACAWGHYKAAVDRDVPCDEFSISQDEDLELFDTTGCGRAKTAKAAARYIRKFVKRKQAELAEARKAEAGK